MLIFILVLILSLCVSPSFAIPALPEVNLNIENSSGYGVVVNPRYANLLDPCSALGFEISFGSREFRGNTTWVKKIGPHQLKLTGEYLSQQILFNFLSGNTSVWDGQYSLGAGYSFLPPCTPCLGIDFNGYVSSAPDLSLPTIYQFGDGVAILYRGIRGGNATGAYTGITFSPGPLKLSLGLFYDDIHYATSLPNHNRRGLGVGARFTQVIQPCLKVNFEANHRELFDHYQCKLTYLTDFKSQARLETSIVGQYISGDLPVPQEKRLGLMLTYRWNLACGSNLVTNALIDAATRPLLRFPQTMVVADQVIIN